MKPGDRVKISEGIFKDYAGRVEEVNEEAGRVIVIIKIFGRETPVELERPQIEPL